MFVHSKRNVHNINHRSRVVIHYLSDAEYLKLCGLAWRRTDHTELDIHSSESFGIEVHTTDKAELYVLTSPVGGSGVIAVSLAAAIHLAKQGKRVLFCFKFGGLGNEHIRSSILRLGFHIRISGGRIPLRKQIRYNII